MPVDPQIAAFLPLIASAPPLSAGTAKQARANMRVLTVDMRDPSVLAPVKSTEDVTFDGPAGPRAARIYRPENEGAVPTILFLHGGGWVIGDIDTHDDQARLLARDTGSVVFSVDYRLAPEHPFPAAPEDCIAALEHVFAIVDQLGGDASRIAVAGDSAGGNLSAVVAIAARDKGLALKAQLLVYPSVDFSEEGDYPSRVDNAEGYLLTSDDMLWFRDQYRPDPTDTRRASVIGADLAGLAPAVVATAEYDPLRDEGNLYASLLEKAGVPVTATQYAGLIHGFFGLGAFSEGAKAAVTQICADFAALLA